MVCFGCMIFISLWHTWHSCFRDRFWKCSLFFCVLKYCSLRTAGIIFWCNFSGMMWNLYMGIIYFYVPLIIISLLKISASTRFSFFPLCGSCWLWIHFEFVVQTGLELVTVLLPQLEIGVYHQLNSTNCIFLESYKFLLCFLIIFTGLYKIKDYPDFAMI